MTRIEIKVNGVYRTQRQGKIRILRSEEGLRFKIHFIDREWPNQWYTVDELLVKGLSFIEVYSIPIVHTPPQTPEVPTLPEEESKVFYHCYIGDCEMTYEEAKAQAEKHLREGEEKVYILKSVEVGVMPPCVFKELK